MRYSPLTAGRTGGWRRLVIVTRWQPLVTKSWKQQKQKTMITKNDNYIGVEPVVALPSAGYEQSLSINVTFLGTSSRCLGTNLVLPTSSVRIFFSCLFLAAQTSSSVYFTGLDTSLKISMIHTFFDRPGGSVGSDPTYGAKGWGFDSFLGLKFLCYVLHVYSTLYNKFCDAYFRT